MTSSAPPPPPPPTTTTSTAVTTTTRRHDPPRQIPLNFREDCWSEDETYALIDAWGSIHLALNRGSLRQHQWSEVSSAVNSTSRRRSWTDVQCKNRLDTLKKRYKVEKAKLAADFSYVSPWPFFNRLDFLIAGDNFPSPAPPIDTPPPLEAEPLRSFPPPPQAAALPPLSFPVKRRSVLPKRPARWLTEEEEEEDVPRRQNEVVEEEGDSSGGGDGDGEGDGYKMLAEAIRRLGEVYERVETIKQEQVLELEKHRLEFVRDLELQRIQLLMDTQNQLFSRFKRSKLNPNPNTKTSPSRNINDDDVGED